MIVAVDIGNSNVVIGGHGGESWDYFWRIQTTTSEDHPLFYDVEIRNLILESGFDKSKVTGIILSSVVPVLRESFKTLLQSIFQIKPIIVGPELYEEMEYKVPRPYEIGTDLVANAFSAFHRLQKPCIVVDFGTALTFTTVDHTGYILGVAIAPGIKTAMKALSNNTAQLPEIPLELPDSVLGNHTTHAMQAGILWGYVGMAKELIRKIHEEVGDHFVVIATGGLSFIMKPIEKVFEHIDPELTLNGLKLMYESVEKVRTES